MITVILFKTQSHYEELIKGTKKRRLNEILDQLITDKKRSLDLINDFIGRLKKLEEEKKFYLQKNWCCSL